ncbi:hypothetical protein F66182_2443 [Fusarium sp. NRRL 66182]|nr:hypothetical protein F66182_2443 [Fusarium sp. NRRL 66182]
MASRRALLSSALRTLPSIRPARPIFSSAANTTRPSRAPRAIAPFANSKRFFTNDDAAEGSKRWSFVDIKKQLEQDKDSNLVIVDVREPRELFETGKIPGAINIPITSAVQSFHMPEEDFEEMYGFERPAKDKELLFYCKAGVRAKAAAGLAQHAGWKKVGDYPGSWLDWADQKGPVEKVERPGRPSSTKQDESN